MNESSFLKASNIDKLNKELTELKSRKVLTDMLNAQIDTNEQLTTENTTLIANQRKLLALLEAKDQTISEMKTMTSSVNSFCHDLGASQQFQNGDQQQSQLIEEYEWQMILHRISRGTQIAAGVLSKREMTSKQSVLNVLKSNVSESDRLALCAVVKNTRVGQATHALSSFVAANQKAHAIEFFSSLQRRWIDSLQLEVQSVHETNNRQQQQLQKLHAQQSQQQLPIQLHAKFYERLTSNPSKKPNTRPPSTASEEILLLKLNRREFQANSSDEQSQQEQIARQQCPPPRALLKRISKSSRDSHLDSCYSRKYKQLLEQFCGLVHESANLMSQDQVNEFIMKTQTLVKNIQTNYTAKCAEFDELQSTHARVSSEVQSLSESLNRQEHAIRGQAEQEKRQLLQEIDELHASLARASETQVSRERDFETEKIEMIEDTRNEERRVFKESMERMMRQVARKEEESRAAIDAHEASCESLKRELLKCQEQMKSVQFERDESAMMSDQLTRKVQALAQEKVGLLTNMEVCVSSLRELKVASDAAHANLAKLKEEKQEMLREIEAKADTLASANAKIAELTRKIQASPNRNVKEEAAKLARIQQENEQLNETIDDLTRSLAKAKKDNQELTKEAIAIHQEKLTLADDLKASQEEISQLESFRSRLELRIEEIGARLSEKENILSKYIGKPTAMQKLSLEKAEVEEENERLKQEFMELHAAKNRLEEELKIVSAREASAAEELRENNSNMAALTREKLGFFKELSKLQDKQAKKKKKIACLKESQAMFQQQIQDYDSQLQMYSKVLKQMDLKSKAAKTTSKNALLNNSSQNHNNSLSASMNLNNNNSVMFNNNSIMGQSQYQQQQQQQPNTRQQRQKSMYDSNENNSNNVADSQLINRIEALQTNFYQ